MAEKKSSGFRFRLPWFQQPASTPASQPPSKSPRATTQTSVASTSVRRPPFRPPGKAPAQVAPVAAPPMVATPAPEPASPGRSPQQPVAPPPSPPPSKSSVPKSPIAKTIEPVATHPAKETKTTTETIPTIETKDPATPPLIPPIRPPREAPSQPSPPRTPPAEKPESEPSSPRTPPQSNSQPLSPSHKAAHLHEATPPRAASNPPSPFHLPPSQTHTPPRSLSPSPSPSPSPSAFPSASQPKDKPSPPTETTSEVAEIKRSIETSEEKFPVDTNHVPQVEDLALDANPREITKVKAVQAKSMDSNSMESKSENHKPITPARVPLHREIKDDISKFMHKIATSTSRQSMDEKPASVITIAGDNTGAAMHLGSDAIKRGYKLNTDSNAHDAAINGNRSSQRDSKASEDQETKAIVNSNIQGINNSMMLNSSVNERNPGVHLGYYRTLANINDSKMKNTEAMEMQRAEVSVTPPQKFIYDPPNERSREGLSMDASESEADDPETSGKGSEIEVL